MAVCTNPAINSWMMEFFSLRKVFLTVDSSQVQTTNFTRVNFTDVMKQFCKFDNASHMEIYRYFRGVGGGEPSNALLNMYIADSHKSVLSKSFASKEELFRILDDEVFLQEQTANKDYLRSSARSSTSNLLYRISNLL